MKIRNNNPLDLEGQDGETITVKIAAHGTLHLVNSNLDGVGAPLSAGIPLTFTLSKAAHDPSVLVLFFTFTNPSGAIYDIDVTGSGGGSSHYTVIQLPGQAANAIAYTFDVV
jgi:hypothetical protein